LSLDKGHESYNRGSTAWFAGWVMVHVTEGGRHKCGCCWGVQSQASVHVQCMIVLQGQKKHRLITFQWPLPTAVWSSRADSGWTLGILLPLTSVETTPLGWLVPFYASILVQNILNFSRGILTTHRQGSWKSLQSGCFAQIPCEINTQFIRSNSGRRIYIIFMFF
jgi:hypothetical protein